MRPTGRGTALFAGLCALAVLPGCGGSSPAPISASSASTLHGDVQRIRSAAAERNAQKAHAAVGALRNDIGRLVERGELARSDARVLTIDVGQIDRRVSIELTPATSAPATPSPSAAGPSAPNVGNGNGDGHGRGKGHEHGHGGGDGGD